MTFLPPPANGGTVAGDISFNSNVDWQIGSNYDLMTVDGPRVRPRARPGRIDGLDRGDVRHLQRHQAKRFASDDVAGIESIYRAPQFDQFNDSGVRDNTYSTATNINLYLANNAQIAVPGLDITTAGDSEWFYVNVPADTTGTMSVTAQSSNLSSLSPKLQVYNASLGLVGQAGTIGSLGATVTVSTSVQSGQGYYIKVFAAGGPGPVGSYGLLVNFGNQPQAPIPPPDTLVPSQPDAGGGAILNSMIVGPSDPIYAGNNGGPPPVWLTVGGLSGWGDSLCDPHADARRIRARRPRLPNPQTGTTVPTGPSAAPITTTTASATMPTTASAPKNVPSPLKLLHKKHVNQEWSKHHKKPFDEHVKLRD